MLKPMEFGAPNYTAMQSSDHGFLERDGNGLATENCGYGSPIVNAVQSPPNYSTSDESPVSIKLPYTFEQEQPRRTVSREGSGALRHPTPDLQSLQGAYIGNVERLEQSAERLSLSSDIGEELRKMNFEQRKSKSRSSSIRAVQMGQAVGTLPSLRQVSTSSNMSNSIRDLNNIARSGGLLPNGHVISPAGSIRSPCGSLHSPRQRQKLLSERVTRTSDLDPKEHPSNAVTFTSFGKDVGISQQSLQVKEHEIIQHPVALRELATALLPSELQHDLSQATTEFPERPVTAVSTDSHRQAMHLFADFDGVHIPSHPNQPPRIIEPVNDSENLSALSLQEPLPVNDRSTAPEASSRAQDMVYYPAPVPVMLNLPQKWSKPRPSQRNTRWSEMPNIASLSATRKSMLALPEMLQDEGDGARNTDDETHRSMAKLPPQLKAELFFEHKPVQQNIELKGGSAVATLDSILDASAHAPINAFIDHPIAGQVGAEIFGKSSLGKSVKEVGAIYGRPREGRSLLNILKHRSSRTTLLENKRFSSMLDPESLSTSGEPSASHIEDRSARNDAEASELSGNEEGTGDTEDVVEKWADGELYNGYNGIPTTLLAELQIRKQQQQQRGRTAAKAFPNGMRSTLLELDAVAQVEKQTRKQKQVTLAWEDPNAQHCKAKNESDEDVPLGVLYPGRRFFQSGPSGHLDEDQPLGLVAKRTIEDNEPLSRRRARLRGESEIPRDTGLEKHDSMYPFEEPGLVELNVGRSTEEDGETLAQRLKRLRDVEQKSTYRALSGDFMSEVMSSVGIPSKTAEVTEAVESRTPNPEETLGQRRKRLQAEKEALFHKVNRENINDPRPSAMKRHTMAHVLQARPPEVLRTTSSEFISSRPVLAGLTSGFQYQDPGVPSSSFGTVNQTLSDTIPNGYGFALPGSVPYKTHRGNVHPLDTAPTSHVNPKVFTANAMNLPESVDLSLKGQAPMSGMGRELILDNLEQRAMIDQWRQSVV